MSENYWRPGSLLATLADDAREGWPTFLGAASVPIEDGLVLYAAVVRLRPRRIVETGTFGGFSAAIMAAALADAGVSDGHIWTVDHDYRQGFPERAWASFGISDRVTRILSDTRTAKEPEGPIDFLFLDALHDAEFVFDEWKNFRDRMAPHGAVAIHDTNLRPPDSSSYDAAVRIAADWGAGRVGFRASRGIDLIVREPPQ